jgi:DNA repair protein RecN (Recombination protein N)
MLPCPETMLRDLHLKNLAVLEEAAIELRPGFNVLSGETGAGKSIVVDSLALLAGARASADLIRTGADALQVTGVFEPAGGDWRRRLEEAGVEAGDGELVVRREINREGRNRVFVNDQPVTLKLLADLAPALLRIHGQREELGLVAPELQRVWLDRSAGAEAAALLERTAAAYAAWDVVGRRLERRTGDDRVRQERLDLLRFQAAEIDAAELRAGEEEELRREREVLRHSEAIQEALAGACDLLFEQENAAWEALGRARHHLEQVASWEPLAAAWAAELAEIHVRLGDLESDLGRRREEVEADPRRLNAIEDRLALLERLMKKYGTDSGAVLAHRRAVAEELDELESDESAVAALEDEARAALGAYRETAGALSGARRTWAGQFTRRVEKELRELSLARARFAVELGRRKRGSSPLAVDGEGVEFNELGYDQVVYLFSPNPGEELRPLGRVASGGELSRLYLAVQLAARGTSATASGATLVFDEVDAGVGGAEAATLGAKLRRLARGGQILAVTHLPQVASSADVHFKVTKEVRRGRTHTAVERLEEARRVDEVARMLAGAEVTELSLSHARELIAAGAAA